MKGQNLGGDVLATVLLYISTIGRSCGIQEEMIQSLAQVSTEWSKMMEWMPLVVWCDRKAGTVVNAVTSGAQDCILTGACS